MAPCLTFSLGALACSSISQYRCCAHHRALLQRKGGAGRSLSSGENMKYSDDDGDGMGGQDDMDDLDGGTALMCA